MRKNHIKVLKLCPAGIGMQNKTRIFREHTFNCNQNAAIGIGAMIVFIAMVLVAGIAASVIIQTANTLEIRANTAGEETKDEVGTGLRVYHIEGKLDDRKIGNTWFNNSFSNMTIEVDPRAGSRNIDLAHTIIEISNGTVKNILSYNSGEPDFSSSVSDNGLFATTDDSSGIKMFEQTGSTFGIIVIKDADNSCSADNPAINRGDMVKLTINATAVFGRLRVRTDIWGQVIPEEGSPGVFSLRTPACSLNKLYSFY